MRTCHLPDWSSPDDPARVLAAEGRLNPSLLKLVNETEMLCDDRNDEEMNDKNCFVLVYEKLTMLRRLPFRRLHKIPISLKCI